jgi:DsbC/DsbD-like thiol-disulfide interchange protein
MARWCFGRISLGFLILTIAALQSQTSAQGVKKSDSVVKVTATADKPDADGKQIVTVVLNHDAGWHTYANPVGQDDLANAQTTITVNAKTKPEDVKVEYPPGKLIKDKIVGDYKVYEEKTSIKAIVKRAKGDTSPLEVSVKFQACTDKQCLLGSTVKLTVP